MKPFVRSSRERIASTAVGGFAIYLFEAELGLQHFPVPVRALMYAAGVGVFCWGKCLFARRVAVPGTDSLSSVVEYRS